MEFPPEKSNKIEEHLVSCKEEDKQVEDTELKRGDRNSGEFAGSIDNRADEDELVRIRKGGSFDSMNHHLKISKIRRYTDIAPKSKEAASSCRNLVDDAWLNLKKGIVIFNGNPVGTRAALDSSGNEALNYDQVFVRDFVPTGLAYLMKAKRKDGKPTDCLIVKNFLLETLRLQGCKKVVDNFSLGDGVMPASFKVKYDRGLTRNTIVADYGETAIGRVAPVDSAFWWIILLRAHCKATGNRDFVDRRDVQKGLKLILNLCLSDAFDTSPTLLCADGCSMIDRRMGIHGYPIDIQTLLFYALRFAKEMLNPDIAGNRELLERIDRHISALSFHIRSYYWMDLTQLNNINRYKTEEYSHSAVNKFNVNPESIPQWLIKFMTVDGGYFVGDVSPGRMDYRWFLMGNCIAILSGLATAEQANAIMELFEKRKGELIGDMPLKIVYPALEGKHWEIITGHDTKNTVWSYHNGGSWPVLLWLFTAACVKCGKLSMAKEAIKKAEKRLGKDSWPEYYDGETGSLIGKQARKLQTWSMSGYLVAKMLVADPTMMFLFSLSEQPQQHKRSHSM